MSSRSRALDMLADHFDHLAEDVRAWKEPAPTIYTAADMWDAAADMARRTALDERWRDRLGRRLRALVGGIG